MLYPKIVLIDNEFKLKHNHLLLLFIYCFWWEQLHFIHSKDSYKYPPITNTFCRQAHT